MTDEPKQNRRMTLGPELSRFVDSLPDQSATALDKAFQSLCETRDRVADLEKERGSSQHTIASLLTTVSEMSTALSETSQSVSQLTEMMDHRTQHMTTIFLHISTLVGTKFADGDERDRLHRRLQELSTDLEKQMDVLSKFVRDQQTHRERTVSQVVGRAEEERLTLAEQQGIAPPQQARQDRGMER